jgi:hypothetical protein
MDVQIVIENRFGIFKSKIISNLTEENFNELIEVTKINFLTVFDLFCYDNSYVIIPPDIMRESIIKINIINNEKEGS